MSQKKAIEKINKQGVLLMFPVNNATEPKSVWSELYPRTKMTWEWSDDGDDRIVKMWRLMKALSNCREVVYSKWYQGRATFFSRKLFTALLKLTATNRSRHKLSRQARDILDVLEENSPLSTKEIKKMTDLQGKDNERFYSRAMKELFSLFLIIGFGEVEDGAFPSLAVGATRLIYEDLWPDPLKLSETEAQKIIDAAMPPGSKLRRHFDKINQI